MKKMPPPMTARSQKASDRLKIKKNFLQYLKKAQKQKEIGLWLITEPVDATTKKEELLGVALSVSDEETVFYA